MRLSEKSKIMKTRTHLLTLIATLGVPSSARKALFSFAALMLAHAMPAMGEVVIVTSLSSGNTYVNSSVPNATGAGAWNMYVQNKTSDTAVQQQAYLKFQLPEFSEALSGAVLEVIRDLNQAGGNPGVTLSLYSAPNFLQNGTTPWTTSNLTWNNQPSAGTLLATISISPVTTSLRDASITTAYQFSSSQLDAYLNTLGSGAEASFRIVISGYNAANFITLFRDQSNVNRNPALILDVVPEPRTVTLLVFAGVTAALGRRRQRGA